MEIIMIMIVFMINNYSTMVLTMRKDNNDMHDIDDDIFIYRMFVS